jgi:hypothetical protein
MFSTQKNIVSTAPVLTGPAGTLMVIPDNPGKKLECGLRTEGRFKVGMRKTPLVSIVTADYPFTCTVGVGLHGKA